MKIITSVKLVSMMRYFFIAALFLLHSCSGIKVSQDYIQSYNFTSLKTFAWKPGDYGLKGNEIVDDRIREAIVDRLTAMSYQHVLTERPDFFISYDLTVEQKVTDSGTSGSISMGRGGYGRYGGVGISTGTQVRTYDEGTLLIDFIDPLEDKLIWRGIGSQVVDQHSSPDKSRVIINEIVEKILSQFPPERRS